MTLLQRYFWTQALWPLIFSLSALSLLALLTQSLQTLDLIFENRQSAVTFLYITVLALPQLIAIILPLAVFIATLYALNRFNADSELIVVKASGVSPWQIASPLMRLGVYAMIVHLILNLWVQPYAFREMRGEIFKVKNDIASQLVIAGKFVTPTNGLTVYAREVSPDGAMQDILIYDERDDTVETMHTAQFGYLTRNAESTILTLKNGNVQQKFSDGVFDLVSFDNYQVGLTDMIGFDSTLHLKSSDRFLHELLYPDPREYVGRKHQRKLTAEGHSRLATPLYNLALVMLALCFMIRGEHQRLGYGRRITICVAIGFAIRLSCFGLISAAEGNAIINWAQYGIPLTVIISCALYLLRKRRVRGIGKLFKKQSKLQAL